MHLPSIAEKLRATGARSGVLNAHSTGKRMHHLYTPVFLVSGRRSSTLSPRPISGPFRYDASSIVSECGQRDPGSAADTCEGRGAK